MNSTVDERGGWTSASSAEADWLCPGRHLAQRGLAEESKSEDAESGTRIHSWLEGKSVVLTADEQETAEACHEIEVELVSRFWPNADNRMEDREQRMWLHHNDLHHSGKADVIYHDTEAALVLDYKTGRNEVEESPRNRQLRDLAVLVSVNIGVKRVHVAVIQPWVTREPEVCTYELDDLIAARNELVGRIVASNNPNSKRIPGETQCKYCRAKAQCPAFLAAGLPLSVSEATADNIPLAIAALPGAKLGAFLSLCRLAEETATEEVRRRVEAGQPVDGWTLKPGRETEKITDAQTVFTRAIEAGVTQEAFVRDCITVGKTALKSAVKAATGAKGKALDAKMAELLAGATETKTSQPVLTQV